MGPDYSPLTSWYGLGDVFITSPHLYLVPVRKQLFPVHYLHYLGPSFRALTAMYQGSLYLMYWLFHHTILALSTFMCCHFYIRLQLTIGA
jgi:hypothetical protein